MKKLLLPIILFVMVLIFPGKTSAATTTSQDLSGFIPSMIGGLSVNLVGCNLPTGTESNDPDLQARSAKAMNLSAYITKCPRNESGQVYAPGLLGTQARVVSLLYDNQISSEEYFADLLDNIGVPSVSRAYAQSTSGTGYSALTSFLPFWKVFRNLAYSLYIIMFVVVGIMIMLRTKVNAQTVITIQSALPNLLITLILITFSYAIVGFMIDIMYFLIYLVVYLVGSVGIINSSKMIERLLSHSAWSVVFAGRNSIISAVAASLGSVLWNLGTGALGVAGAALSIVSPMYLIVAVAFAIAMIKLMIALIQAYVMVIVQVVTAPLQILMNAMPGSKAFSGWLKKTASYLIPFPVAASMFIFSAVLVGNPTDKTLLKDLDPNDANPFGVNKGAEIYQNRENIWLPPFTLTEAKVNNTDVLTIIGFFIFLMTPSAVKMAQEWLQVKESPYASEAVQGFTGVLSTGVGYGTGYFKQTRALKEQRAVQEYGAGRYADKMAEELRKQSQQNQVVGSTNIKK